MSTMPWGTMNGWLRTEAEQPGAWTRQRVQDLRAARVDTAATPIAAKATPRPAAAPAACAA